MTMPMLEDFDHENFLKISAFYHLKYRGTTSHLTGKAYLHFVNKGNLDFLIPYNYFNSTVDIELEIGDCYLIKVSQQRNGWRPVCRAVYNTTKGFKI